MGARLRPRLHAADGRLRLDVHRYGDRHRPAGGALLALLHVAGGPGAAVLRVTAGLLVLHAGHRSLRQSDPSRVLLGTDELFLLLVVRLLAPHTESKTGTRTWRATV